jgi:hypothetical protein
VVGFEHRLLDGEEGIAVEPLTHTLDGRAHRPRMRGKIEHAEVHVPRIQIELLPHALPVTRIQWKRCRYSQPVGEADCGCERGCGGREAAPYEQPPAGEMHGPSLIDP